MATPTFDLKRRHYNLSDPLEAARFGRTSLEFMEAVRRNAFQEAGDLQLMDEFCTFVSSHHVWHLAQNVVPEFRSAPTAEKDVPETCLEYVLRRSKLPLLPAPRNDENILSSEQKMLRDRHRTYVEYLVTGGKTKHEASHDERVAIDRLCQQVQDIRATVRQDAEEVARQSAEDE